MLPCQLNIGPLGSQESTAGANNDKQRGIKFHHYEMHTFTAGLEDSFDAGLAVPMLTSECSDLRSSMAIRLERALLCEASSDLRRRYTLM